MLSEMETRKDLVEEAVQSAAAHVGRIASIISGAVADVTREFGAWGTDVFEMVEAGRKARSDDPGD